MSLTEQHHVSFPKEFVSLTGKSSGEANNKDNSFLKILSGTLKTTIKPNYFKAV